MIDIEKTKDLRKKLKMIKKESTEEKDSKESKENDSVYSFFYQTGLLIAKVAVIYGSQYFILKKVNVVPFNIWETAVILLGSLTVASSIKKIK